MNELKEQHHLDLIWDAYKNNNDLKARDLLLEEYIPLVKYVAGRLALSLPHNVETGDLESFGFFGLLDAMEKYDQLRNIKFETYASTRIRGAIIDGLRSMDWVPRSTRSKARSLETQIYRLTNELGRNPEDSEIAAALDVSPERYYELLNEVRGTTLFSLDEAVTTDSQNDNLKLLDLVIDKDISHDERLLQNEIVEELSGAIEKLSEREQLVLALYYYEELTLKEIGHVLDVSESRVSQIHTKAILTLRSMLKNH
ncbi:MAG: FliA/WhiG family RNA polymerase sigma factor [Bacillota bacterium]|nr:FliA/WhiG family RNA polymerase sigma factor [Bacillota bacterium]HHU62258.1 FliA/WhiG family RNA polymerase sigma factor [Natronincola sp.]